MNFKKLTFIVLALVLAMSLSACQLSEVLNKDSETTDNASSDTVNDSGSTDTSDDTASTDIMSYVPEGVDLDYTMDYLNEDLSAYVTLGEYKGLSAEITTYEVNDAYVEEKIGELLESEATPAKITDRVTAEGDVICVDYEGTLDGVAFAGGSASNVSITLSENSGYIPGFVDGMYGVMPGETVSYDVTFPEVYQNNPDLAGKLTVFTVTVHYIEGEDVAPELNDEFVKEHFGAEGCETVEDFMTYYKGYLESERADDAKADATAAIWSQIMENATVISLPEKAVETMYWLNRANYEVYAAQYGMEYEEFLAQYVGSSDEAIMEYAENYIKEDIVIYSVVKAEGIEITDEEYAEGVAKFAVQYEMTEEELVESYGEARIEGVLQWNKLMDALYEWSNITEVVE